MSPTTLAFLSPIVLALLGGVGWLFRWILTRSDSEQAGSLSLSQAWSLANASLATEVGRLTAQHQEMSSKIGALEESDSVKTREISEMRFDLKIILFEVVPIVEWIDNGAPPPPPFIPERLRSLIERHREQLGMPATEEG